MGIARKLLFQRFVALDRLRNCFPVGEHTAQPAMVDKVLARFARSLGNWVLRLTLGSDEQHLAAMRHCLRHEIQRARKERHGLGQVKNMDAIPRSEEHTSELKSLMRISYAVFCLTKKTKTKK